MRPQSQGMMAMPAKREVTATRLAPMLVRMKVRKREPRISKRNPVQYRACFLKGA